MAGSASIEAKLHARCFRLLIARSPATRSGSPRSPMGSCAPSGASVLPTSSSPKRPATQSGSSSSSSPVSSASERAASNSRSPQLVATPTNGGWPPSASSQPPDASPRRRKNAAIQPAAHRRPPKRPTPSAQTAPGTRSSSLQSLRNHRRVPIDQAPPVRNGAKSKCVGLTPRIFRSQCQTPEPVEGQ
jgi:hypothetical protein